MPYINVITVSQNTEAEAMEAIGVTAGLSLEGLVVGVQTVVPVTLPKSVRHRTKNVFTATRRDTSVSFVIQSNMESLLDQM